MQLVRRMMQDILSSQVLETICGGNRKHKESCAALLRKGIDCPELKRLNAANRDLSNAFAPLDDAFTPKEMSDAIANFRVQLGNATDKADAAGRAFQKK